MRVRADMVNGHGDRPRRAGVHPRRHRVRLLPATASLRPRVAAAAEIVFVTLGPARRRAGRRRRRYARRSAAAASTTSPCAAATRSSPSSAAARSQAIETVTATRRGRPGYDLESPARGRRRGVQRARLRRHLAWRTSRSGSASASRRSTTTWPSKDELLRLGARPGARRSVRGAGRGPAARRAGDRPAGAPGPRQRRGAAGAAALRDAAAAGARQHRGRARRADPAPRSSTATWPAWCGRPRRTATSAPTSIRRSRRGCCSAW